MQELLEWAAAQLPAVDAGALGIVPVAGDASFRRYFRISGCEPTRIAVFAPPDKERNAEFVHIAALLRAAGVAAPEVLAHEPARGFLLLGDLGDSLLLPALTPATVDGFYGRAMDTLLAIQSAALEHAGWRLPDYSAALLRQEMDLFPAWFLRRLLGIEPDATALALIGGLFDALIASALEQPQVFVHRDYHSRNLMLLADGGLGVIDFQDAVRGPLTYDLVSLLRDCYIAWPPAQVRGWALGFARRAAAAGRAPTVDDARFLRWFDLMGLQRHIKVLGIFARLWLRDGKRGYLGDLPLVMHYTLEVTAAHPQFADFDAWFRAVVLPAAARQDWYRAP